MDVIRGLMEEKCRENGFEEMPSNCVSILQEIEALFSQEAGGSVGLNGNREDKADIVALTNRCLELRNEVAQLRSTIPQEILNASDPNTSGGSIDEFGPKNALGKTDASPPEERAAVTEVTEKLAHLKRNLSCTGPNEASDIGNAFQDTLMRAHNTVENLKYLVSQIHQYDSMDTGPIVFQQRLDIDSPTMKLKLAMSETSHDH